jgi:hypothetical protein
LLARLSIKIGAYSRSGVLILVGKREVIAADDQYRGKVP